MYSAGDASHRLLEKVEVLDNERLAEGVGLITLQAPEISARVCPGQFVHVRIAYDADFILRRPFSVHRAEGTRIEILYQVLGRGTRALSLKERGDVMDAVGPLGSGFGVPDGAAHALVVAGGLGAAPMGMLVEDLATRGVAVTMAVGAPTAGRILRRGLFEANVRRFLTATDDGSDGVKGLVTVLSAGLVKTETPDIVYACGPEAMCRAVAAQAAAEGVACQVSLERLMACGIGACLSCVVSTAAGLEKACVDGPVFDARRIEWKTSEIPPRH